MLRIGICVVILGIVVAGCADYKPEIVKIIDFELSPDENKIAFSALTPIGNTDVWVVDIDGTNLKKLTFKDRSPSNHIVRFFRKHKWRNFYRIDMRAPEWTKDGRISFCQRLTKHDMWGVHIVSLKYWTIDSDGIDRRPETDKDMILRRKPFDAINRAEVFDTSEKHKKKIFLKDGTLWALDFGEATPKKLIQ